MRTPVVGSSHTVEMTVDERVTVPGLLPEVPSWAEMPPVLATAMLVACMEWAALEALKPFLDDDERSLGIVVDMTHTAPTPIGVRVRATATIRAVEGRQIDFDVEASDDNGPVGRANHRRAVIETDRFRDRIATMQAAAADR
ncbi:MAG: thioesterase family protein [Candidatus Eremiobacteraeota bacterium]|nr:thioesterase family protein [Candidatus Eremiobacteraeota bacterium]